MNPSKILHITMLPRSILHALAAVMVLGVGPSSTLAHPLEGRTDLTPLATNKNVIIQVILQRFLRLKIHASSEFRCLNGIGHLSLLSAPTSSAQQGELPYLSSLDITY
jgi:hypothetical protein